MDVSCSLLALASQLETISYEIWQRERYLHILLGAVLACQTPTRARRQECAIRVDPFKFDVGRSKAGERTHGKEYRLHVRSDEVSTDEEG